ncbi:hypothetical protein [Pseudoteredinibacter isoporae]|uniref:Iron transporter n=1 Tax=Pseudoteredinibacter isoporae TaxID=570281 RepID=A0A7X0JWP5_9GAMM|nr:hypothetical protein [Pseudoteredinibacter isoporae]MBB6523625.1 hypothetical protein [Pseudoteredinibacter isoporae]NHO89132.1 hypothetical protein [Pseudoteredinibacter isoporae]NIB22257.1 hypothetical protein [Pseudoteredinibacter isoporae]
MKYAPTFIKYRILLACLGGYLVANLCAIALSKILPISMDESVALAMACSFLFYTAAIIWVFSTSTLKSASLGLLIAALISLVIVVGSQFLESAA